MPQPADVWPPQPFDTAFARFAEHDAWYCGDNRHPRRDLRRERACRPRTVAAASRTAAA